MKVAFVGLGTMGQPMAINVVKKGYALSVLNRSPEKALPLNEAGAAPASSPKEGAMGRGLSDKDFAAVKKVLESMSDPNSPP